MLWTFIGVAGYLVVLLGLGLAASRRTRGLDDYYAGGKRLGYWAVAFSARATGTSAWLLLGLTGMGAAVGVRALWVVLGEILGVATAWLVMAGRFKRLTDRYDSLTVPDYLASRFGAAGGRGLRAAAAGALVVFVTIYVSAQIDATGTAFETFLGVDYHVGSVVGFAVVMAYSVGGGFLAVVWSDVFQGVLMVVGLVALPLFAWTSLDGPLGAQLAAIDPSLLRLSGAEGWTTEVVVGTAGLVLIGLGFLGSPQIFVRFLALRSAEEIPRGAGVALAWSGLAGGGAVLVGMVGRVVLDVPGAAMIGPGAVLGNGGQDVLPRLTSATFPAFVVGLYIAVVLSAIMSTVDSLLVLASSAAVRDGYQKLWRPHLPDAALVPYGKRATLALALVALAIATGVAWVSETRTIFWFAIFGWSGIAATFCPTMVLSLFWRGLTSRGAVAAMATGFVGVPLFEFGVPHWVGGLGPLVTALGALPPAFALGLTAGVLVSVSDRGGRATVTQATEALDAAGGTPPA
ncbi:MAG: sodium/proline symporter [Myxococcota bacterium]